MDDKLNRLEGKLDRLDERLDGMSITLVRNTDLLEIHIKRTDLLEAYVKEEIVQKDLDPIKEHVLTVKAAARVLMWIGGAVGSILAVLVALRQLGVI